MISIVIPTYNRGKVISKAIDSVINQTYKNWELLIVDDGSTDDTFQVLESNYLDRENISYYRRPLNRTKGANACRNIGIEKAEGEFIALLDSDDEWKAHHIEKCVQKVQEVTNFAGCYSGAILKRGKFEFKKKSREIGPDETHFSFLLNGGFAQTSSLFFKREYGLNIKFDENLQRHQDWDFFIRFGREYSWIFNDSCKVIIKWGIDNRLKKIDFKSCISFYNRYKDNVNDKKILSKYLYNIFKRAVLCDDKKSVAFYKQELKQMGFENGLAMKYPFLYRFIEKAKIKLKISSLKDFIVYHYIQFR